MFCIVIRRSLLYNLECNFGKVSSVYLVWQSFGLIWIGQLERVAKDLS